MAYEFSQSLTTFSPLCNGCEMGAAERVGAVLRGECEPRRILKAQGTRLPCDEAQAFGKKYAKGQASYRAAWQKPSQDQLGQIWKLEPCPRAEKTMDKSKRC